MREESRRNAAGLLAIHNRCLYGPQIAIYLHLAAKLIVQPVIQRVVLQLGTKRQLSHSRQEVSEPRAVLSAITKVLSNHEQRVKVP